MGNENEIQANEIEMTDEEIAVLANQKIREQDKEIAKLKKELNKMKLFSTVEPDEEPVLTRDECLKIIFDSNTSQYDYADAVCKLVECDREAGKPNPLGQEGDKVYDFLKDVLDRCDGDKDSFISIYQSRVQDDSQAIAAAYKARK